MDVNLGFQFKGEIEWLMETTFPASISRSF
jgi:hypothetical protein